MDSGLLLGKHNPTHEFGFGILPSVEGGVGSLLFPRFFFLSSKQSTFVCRSFYRWYLISRSSELFSEFNQEK